MGSQRPGDRFFGLGLLGDRRLTAQWASPWFPPSSLRCCGAPGVEKANLSNVRCVIGGVAPLTRHLLEAVERRCDPQVLEGHGLTDGTCVRA
jgi:acyl-CoA synthetase (AMP-forming)/AMP-acid ligase II